MAGADVVSFLYPEQSEGSLQSSRMLRGGKITIATQVLRPIRLQGVRCKGQFYDQCKSALSVKSAVRFWLPDHGDAIILSATLIPLLMAPFTVPLCPSTFVASPAKNNVSAIGSAKSCPAFAPPTFP
jgi:hypothetical protein